MFKYIEEKLELREVADESDACETSIRETTREDINAVLAYGYNIYDDRLPDYDNKQSATDKTDQRVYKLGWKWNVVDYSSAEFFERDAEKLYGTNGKNAVR